VVSDAQHAPLPQSWNPDAHLQVQVVGSNTWLVGSQKMH
jgi:hypothetical protein